MGGNGAVEIKASAEYDGFGRRDEPRLDEEILAVFVIC